MRKKLRVYLFDFLILIVFAVGAYLNLGAGCGTTTPCDAVKEALRTCCISAGLDVAKITPCEDTCRADKAKIKDCSIRCLCGGTYKQ